MQNEILNTIEMEEEKQKVTNYINRCLKGQRIVSDFDQPSMYKISENFIKIFASMFNGLELHPNLILEPNRVETFLNDGSILNIGNTCSIALEVEVRKASSYFANGIFKYGNAGLFTLHRKVLKAKKFGGDALNIQICSDSSSFLVSLSSHHDSTTVQKTYRLKENGVLGYQLNCKTQAYDFGLYLMNEEGMTQFKKDLYNYTINKQELLPAWLQSIDGYVSNNTIRWLYDDENNK